MITIQGNKQILKTAQKLESRTRNIYPHMSTSKIRKHIGYDIPDPEFFRTMKKEYSSMRRMIRESGDIYSSVIYTLSYGRMGNCTEDAMFTELLGKINGQKNIYTGSLGLSKDNKKAGFLNHVVAFITNEPVQNGKDFYCKNKEAVIIDPWLGITDFAGSYFNKLQTIFRKVFMYENDKRFVTFYNDDLAAEIIRGVTKTPEEYNRVKKKVFPNHQICIVPFVDKSLDRKKINALRIAFPELTIKDYKAIKLAKKKSKSIDHLA